MVKRISSKALNCIALAIGVAVIVVNTLNTLAIGSAITLPGLDLAASTLEPLLKE